MSAAAVVGILSFTATPLPPTAYNDNYSVIKGMTKDLTTLLSNDADPKGSNLTITETSKPQWGRVEILSNKVAVRYVAPAHWAGVDTFNYTVSNGWLTSSAMVTVHVLNTPPVAVDEYFSIPRNVKNVPVLPLEYVDSSNGARVKDGNDDELFVDSVSLDTAAIAAGHSVRISDDKKTVFFSPASEFIGTVSA